MPLTLVSVLVVGSPSKKGAKALALTEGRTFVTPQDLQRILPAVFGHRLLLKGGVHASAETLSDLMKQMIQRVPVPTRK